MEINPEFFGIGWGKATHTWDGNQCDFRKENVIFKDGKLILCLTDATNLGYQDNVKPILLWAKAFSNGNVELKFSEEMDIETTETISNYTIPGVTILSVTLSKDLTKVFIETESFDPTVTANIIILNSNDIWGNTISVVAKTIISTDYPEFPLNINVGGNAKYNYLPNQEWAETLHYGYMDSQDETWSSSIEISNTDEDLIYLADGEGLKKYIVKVPNQQYRVTLMFAEKYFNSSGKRVFDITIENNRVTENVDIFNAVRKNFAYDVSYTVTVEDELLEIILSPQIDRIALSGIRITTNPNSVGVNGNEIEKYELLQNYPNPFNPSTTIKYSIPVGTSSDLSLQKVVLKIYDILGREVVTLVNKEQNPGNYEVTFDAKHLTSGIYFYNIQAGSFNKNKKMILLK